MKVSVNLSAVAEIRWYEYIPRFLFGGAITALAGIVAKEYGPSVGGLLLAFPAIFPAGATLLEKHEIEKKQEIGKPGKQRGRKAAALDAAGACIGAVGLVIFAFLVWKLLLSLPLGAVLLIATIAWLVVSATAWIVWQI
jgi:hypothetical protein